MFGIPRAEGVRCLTYSVTVARQPPTTETADRSVHITLSRAPRAGINIAAFRERHDIVGAFRFRRARARAPVRSRKTDGQTDREREINNGQFRR